MIIFLHEEYGIDKFEAYMLCSVAGDLRMHEVVRKYLSHEYQHRLIVISQVDMPNYLVIILVSCEMKLLNDLMVPQDRNDDTSINLHEGQAVRRNFGPSLEYNMTKARGACLRVHSLFLSVLMRSCYSMIHIRAVSQRTSTYTLPHDGVLWNKPTDGCNTIRLRKALH